MKKGFFAFMFILFLVINGVSVGAVGNAEQNWNEETVYSIMIDRFNNGDQGNDMDVDPDNLESYHGGDFKGIIDRLDYIKDMGFTAISLTPIFSNAKGGYHGYWIDDYDQIDEHFGSVELFNKLVQEAHNRDMKVMVEFVISHVSSSHPLVSDPTNKGWFMEQMNSENPNIAILNLGNQEVVDHLVESATYWVQETDIDGYRLHSLQPVPNKFLTEFTDGMKKVKNDFFILGDFIESNPQEMNASIDGVMDYTFNKELRTVFPLPNQAFTSLLQMYEKYDDQENNIATFLDNQYTTRFTHDTVLENEHPGPRWRQALTFLYTAPGIPIVYYGSEIALDGAEPPDNRRQMNFRTDTELIEYITQLGKLRANLPSLKGGSMKVLHEKDGMVVYKRSIEGETTVIAINNTTKTQTVSIPSEELHAEMELRGLLNGDLVRSKDNQFTITIKRDESEVYKLSPKSGINISYIIAIASVLIAFFTFLFLVKKRSRK